MRNITSRARTLWQRIFSASPQPVEKNNLGQNNHMHQPEEKQFFIVTSSGRTASYWLAASLHEHADVICGHSLQVPPVPDYTKPMQWSDVQSILAKAGNSHWNYLSGSKRVYPDEYFDTLEKEGEARFYGCVHTYALHGLMECFAEHPPKRSFKIVHLTRHPINRITSWKSRVIEEWGFSSSARDFWATMYQNTAPHMSLADFARREFGLNTNDDKVIAFICAVIDVAAETSGIGGEYLAVPMERLVSDPQFFIWVLKKITSPDISLNKDYIEKVYSKGKLNPSKHLSTLPFIEFESWQPWERAVFRKACTMWPIPQSFAPLGYDFSFLIEK